MNNKEIIIGIDVTNITSGGGLTHVSELLNNSNPSINNFDKIIIWGSKNTLAQIIDKNWIIKISLEIFEKNFFLRAFWQYKELGKAAKENKCSILLIPGGSYFSNFVPIIAISQNMLPFKWVEIFRYKSSFFILKLIFLRYVQIHTFKKAKGIIFLTDYVQNKLLKLIKDKNSSTVIPHGIDSRFYTKPRKQKPIKSFNSKNPFKIVYVSSFEPYKHQVNVVKTVCKILDEGYPLSLDLIGRTNHKIQRSIAKILKKNSLYKEKIFIHNSIDHKQMHKIYLNYDAKIYASTCENLPIILLESMASGLPIVCSNFEPMPSVLKDGGFYFNPLNEKSIYESILKMINNEKLRSKHADRSYEISTNYSWLKCAEDTFNYLNKNVI